MTTANIRQQQRRASAATWTGLNPVLLDGEIGVEEEADPSIPDKAKMGDGVTPWNDLAYWVEPGGTGGLASHVAAAEPHPAYDVDLPSLTLIFENNLI